MFKLILLLIISQVLLASTADAATTNVNETGDGSTEEPGHGSEEDKCSTHEPFDSSVHIAKLDFERIQTLFIVTVFIMVVVLAKLGKVQFRPLSKVRLLICIPAQCGITSGCILSPLTSLSHGKY